MNPSRRIITFISTISVAVFLFVSPLMPVHGATSKNECSPDDKSCVTLQVPIGDIRSVTVCDKNDGELVCNGIAEFLGGIYSWIITAAAIIAVVVLMFGGMRWMTARGDKSGVASSKKMISNALIGLTLLLGSYSLLYLINPSLTVFKSLSLTTIKKIELPVQLINTSDLSDLVGISSTSGCQDGHKLFKQNDPQWAAITMGNGSAVAPAGCGVSSYANILANHGKNVTPGTIAIATQGSHAGTNGDFTTATKYLSSNQGFTYGSNLDIKSAEAKEKLKLCHMLMTSIKGYKGWFSSGHFITLYAIDSSDQVRILDSSARNITSMSWSDIVSYQTVSGSWFSDLFPDEGNQCNKPGICGTPGGVSATSSFTKPPGMDAVNLTKVNVDLQYKIKSFIGPAPLYPSTAECYLLPNIANSLYNAQASLDALHHGYKLQLWDCYRPLAVQTLMEAWCVGPPKGIVNGHQCVIGSDVAHAGSGKHPLGRAVDVTLTFNGAPTTMPSGFDAFGDAAKSLHCPSSPSCKILFDAMKAANFNQNPDEWWHFDQ